MGCAVGLANIEILEREDLPGRVLEHEAAFRRELESLLDLPIVGDVRGAGYFWDIELVKGKGEPVVQLSPPLVAGPEEFSEIARILRQALGEAGDRMS